jgi:hypothetical protein
MKTLSIHCCGCKQIVQARLIDGKEAYPNRSDLHSLPFWKCDTCQNFVGCHHKTKDRTRPLGCIPTPELKNARQHIHKLLDPLWENEKNIMRKELYAEISKRLGYEYHTADIASIEQARLVYKTILDIKNES